MGADALHQITDAEKNTHPLQDYARLLAQQQDPSLRRRRPFGDLNQLQKALDGYVGQMAFRAFKINSAFPMD